MPAVVAPHWPRRHDWRRRTSAYYPIFGPGLQNTARQRGRWARDAGRGVFGLTKGGGGGGRSRVARRVWSCATRASAAARAPSRSASWARKRAFSPRRVGLSSSVTAALYHGLPLIAPTLNSYTRPKRPRPLPYASATNSITRTGRLASGQGSPCAGRTAPAPTSVAGPRARWGAARLLHAGRAEPPLHSGGS